MHTHDHDHHHHCHHAANNLRTAFFLNLSFTLVEIVGGIATQSIAILADALHDLGDSLSLGIAWFLQRFSERQEDHRFSFGYRRFSLLGGLINCLILMVGSVFILMEAIPRLTTPQEPYAPGMLALAVLGIAVNGAAVIKLAKGKSLNERIVTWHLMEDVLGWIAVLVVSVVLLFRDVPVLDPILSIVITVWVLYNVLGNLKKTFFVFLQGVPEKIPVEQVQEQIRGIDHVLDVHHLRVWTMDGEYNVLSMHVVIEKSVDMQGLVAIKRAVKRIGQEMGIDHMTVEIEFGADDCSQQPL